MYFKKLSSCIIFALLLCFTSFVSANDEYLAPTQNEQSFATEALPFLQTSGYPWTQEVTETFLQAVNDECGYRGMQVFLEILRGKISEVDHKNIAFFCPTLGILETAHPDVSDFSGLMIVDRVAKGKADVLKKALDKAWPYFKKAGGWVRDVAWPAVKATAKWLASNTRDAIAGQAAADFVRERTCNYTGKWCK